MVMLQGHSAKTKGEKKRFGVPGPSSPVYAAGVPRDNLEIVNRYTPRCHVHQFCDVIVSTVPVLEHVIAYQ